MKAYEVILKLFERSEDGDDSSDAIEKIITIAPSLEKASANAKLLYEEADCPEGGFHWEAISAAEIEGKVALPDINKVLPSTS